MRAQQKTRSVRCFDCGLPDYYAGQGDGIGSCDCPRCDECGAGPLECDCAAESSYADHYSEWDREEAW